MAALHAGQRVCPSCGSQHLSRSHRRGLLERYFLTAFRIRPYRCGACDRRFYGRTQSTVDSSANVEGDKPLSPAAPGETSNMPWR
jgi:hypothetical protein